MCFLSRSAVLWHKLGKWRLEFLINVFNNGQGVNSKTFHVSASLGCHVNLFLGPFRSSLPNRTQTGIGRWAPLSPSLCLGLGLHRAFLNALLNQGEQAFFLTVVCTPITIQFHLTAYNIADTVKIHTMKEK